MTDSARSAENRLVAGRMSEPGFIAGWNGWVAELVRQASVEGFLLKAAVQDLVDVTP